MQPSVVFLLCVQLEYEPASFGVACVQCQASVHLGSYQGTDRQSQSVSFRQVFNLRERFEQVLLFFGRNARAGIRDDELMRMRASLLEVEEDLSAFGIFRRVLQQVNQYPFQLFRVGLDL